MDHQNQAMHVMTMANSIIGVSIIAMPYCFKQCGIILSIVILVISSIISRLSCHLLLKSAIMARRRTFEFLAFHAFGSLGKFIVEIGLIGFLMGTCIAFFVVMGDLGPAIVARMVGTRTTDTLRTSILMAIALFCVLPLGLLRNIDSLSSVCTVTIGFYFCLVLKIVAQSLPHIFFGDWVHKVELWRPAGFLQCLPIFSMALFCQTQIFEIYQAIPNASLEKMNDLIRKAVNICTGVYIFVGVFGYIAFCGQLFTGNILMSFPTSFMTEAINIGFVLSVAFSFPLVIFPCRASLYSLLYRRTYSLHEAADKYIPEGRFKGLTFVIVFVSLVIGVMIPNIELVLGLVGSTIGIMICVLFPAMCFICISTKNTNERILAQLMLFIGVIVMVLGTYANLYAMEEMSVKSVITTEKPIVNELPILKLVEEDPAFKVMDIPNTTSGSKKKEILKQEIVKEVRHEPPQPEEPLEPPLVKEVPKIIKQPPEPIVKLEDQSKDKSIDQPQLEENIIEKKEIVNSVQHDTEVKVKEEPVQPAPKDVAQLKDAPESVNVADHKPPKEQATGVKNDIKAQGADNKSNGKKAEEVDKEAIEKEEKELREQEKKSKEEDQKKLDLIKSLERRNAEQKKLLEEIKQRQEALEKDRQQNEIDKVKQEKIKAVEQIQQIAKQAIEKLSANDDQNQLQSNKSSASQSKQITVEKSKEQNEVLKEPQKKHNVNGVVQSLVAVTPKPNMESVAANPDQSKIVLNKENLVPMPLAAASSNFSEVYKNIVALKGSAEHPLQNISQSKLSDVKPEKKGNDESIDKEKERVNLYDILKTKTEKVVNANQNDKPDMLILHREIRSTNEGPLSNDELQKGNNAVLVSQMNNSNVLDKKVNVNEQTVKEESCDKDKQFEESSTEGSLIKMISKLSEPEVVSVNVPDINSVDGDVALKPMKRDLKSYKSRKRK